MLPKPPRFETLIQALNSEGVRFVVIGGLALILHGGRHTTFDTDLAVVLDSENASAIVRALAPFQPYPVHLPEGTPFVWDERSIRGQAVSLRSDCGDIDLLLVVPGVDSMAGLFARSVTREIGGRAFRVASLDDLEAMKREAGRPQDLAHLDELARIRKAMQ
ncbi:MAG TPA: hypothetical protein VHE55_15555 [Fimbriimonadaceae bacterium]|nr:hypothetical protein [Fimbriimonadaceae bacterium]